MIFFFAKKRCNKFEPIMHMNLAIYYTQIKDPASANNLHKNIPELLVLKIAAINIGAKH
jgi:hypothetical protein